jgi:hypothetical protein
MVKTGPPPLLLACKTRRHAARARSTPARQPASLRHHGCAARHRQGGGAHGAFTIVGLDPEDTGTGTTVTLDRDAGEQAALALTVGNTDIGKAAAPTVAFTIAGLDPEDAGTILGSLNVVSMSTSRRVDPVGLRCPAGSTRDLSAALSSARSPRAGAVAALT